MREPSRFSIPPPLHLIKVFKINQLVCHRLLANKFLLLVFLPVYKLFWCQLFSPPRWEIKNGNYSDCFSRPSSQKDGRVRFECSSIGWLYMHRGGKARCNKNSNSIHMHLIKHHLIITEFLYHTKLLNIVHRYRKHLYKSQLFKITDHNISQHIVKRSFSISFTQSVLDSPDSQMQITL